MKELDKHLTSSNDNFTLESQLRTAVVVYFMWLIQRYPTSKLKIFNIATYSILHAPCVKETDIVYDSYLEDSIKECERICWYSSCETLKFINLKTTTIIPVTDGSFLGLCKKIKKQFKKFCVISSKALAARVSIV